MPVNSRISLVVSDVDGTLITKEKKLTARTIAAVARLQKAGIAFALISGRPPVGMRMISEPLGVRTPIYGFNGGLATSPDFRQIIAARYLERQIVGAAIGELDRSGLDVWLYTDENWLVRDRQAPHVTREAETVRMEPKEMAAFPEQVLDAVIKIVGVSDRPDVVKRAHAAVCQKVGHAVVAACSQPYYLDITSKMANKGQAVSLLAEHLGVANEEIVTIGDMPTDVPMFENSGISIAMGNAAVEVQSKAHYTTDDNDNDGFARAIDRFVLGMRS